MTASSPFVTTDEAFRRFVACSLGAVLISHSGRRPLGGGNVLAELPDATIVAMNGYALATRNEDSATAGLQITNPWQSSA